MNSSNNNKIKFLQINLHTCKKAHDILDQYTKDTDIDIVLMSEQNKKIAEDRNYPRDLNNDAAIWIRTSKVRINGIQRELGYVCVITETTLIISAYISPNAPLQTFKNIIISICETLRQHRHLKWIVVGDLNAKSTVWGNIRTDDRGDFLLEIIASVGLFLLNEGNTPTFVRRDRTSIPDISLCSENIVQNISGWKVEAEEESNSDHRYITFYYTLGNVPEEVITTENTPSRWKITNEGLEKLQKELHELSRLSYTTSPLGLMNMVLKACKKTLKKTGRGKDTKKPVYWWNSRIENLRNECKKKRRKMTRANRSRNEIPESLWQAYKETKKSLNKEIDRSKRICWDKICEEVNKDIWGTGYRIVTKKFGIKNAQLSESLERHILDALFPSVPLPNWSPIEIDTASIPPFTTEELVNASSRMKSKKAPGPDRIAAEIVKSTALSCPDHVLRVLNNALKNGEFPTLWKKAVVVLIPKPGKPPFQPSSYRPLCLLDTFGKLLEGLLVQSRDYLTNLEKPAYLPTNMVLDQTKVRFMLYSVCMI